MPGTRRARRLLIPMVLAALLASACASDDGGEDAGESREGPTITVASFNFPESVLLAEIYGQALEENGYEIERKHDLGSREVVFPAIESGEIDLIPEYIGSSLSVGFGEETLPTDPVQGHEALSAAFAEKGVTVLDFAPAEDKNVFVVTEEFAEDNDLETISDLADAGEITFGGPPECEERDTCFKGLQESYGLDNLKFQVMPEGSTRVSSLESGDIQLALLFSTDPIIIDKGWVALEDDKKITPVENIVPVVNDEVVEAYGEELTDVLNAVSKRITTDVLLDLNKRVQIDNEDPEDVARDWL
ncbi:MAG: glycine betaine ABC transporter substrate-binding protein [Actinomycetota bacterium]